MGGIETEYRGCSTDSSSKGLGRIHHRGHRGEEAATVIENAKHPTAPNVQTGRSPPAPDPSYVPPRLAFAGYLTQVKNQPDREMGPRDHCGKQTSTRCHRGNATL